MSHVAAASRSVFVTSDKVRSSVGAGPRVVPTGDAATGASRRGLWQTVGMDLPRSQSPSAAIEQADASAAKAAWPALVIVSRCPCGKLARIVRASIDGERTSPVPVTASTGTSGYVPVAVACGTEETGQLRQSAALLSCPAHDPKPPSESAGTCAPAAVSMADRSA